MNKAIAALPDALIVAGACAVSYGTWLLAPYAGFVVGGMLLIAGGVRMADSLPRPKADG
jgi:hypothetical protein